MGLLLVLILATVLCLASSAVGRLSQDWKTRTAVFGWIAGFAIYGALMAVVIGEPKLELLMLKTFGPRPLGIESTVFGCLVFGAVMAPCIYVSRHLTPVVWATKLPVEYEDAFSKRDKIWSVAVVILGIFYFIAVTAVWIYYAPSLRD